MTFSDSFILDAKLTEAKAECDSASGRLDALSESIGKRLDGQNRSKLISVIAGTLLLAAFYVTAYVFLRRYVEYGYYEYLMIIGNKLAPWTLIASLALIGVIPGLNGIIPGILIVIVTIATKKVVHVVIVDTIIMKRK